MSKNIVCYCRKGGVGKTTFCMQFAAILSKEYKKKVLLIDLDPQASLSNCTPHSEQPEFFLGAILREYWQDGIQEDIRDSIVETKYENLYLMPAASASLEMAEKAYQNADYPSPCDFRDVFLQDIEDEYDYIIIDAAQGVSSIFVDTALCSGDYLISPVNTDIESVNGFGYAKTRVGFLKEKLKTNVAEPLCVFLNRVTLQRKTSKVILDAVRDTYKDLLSENMVRNAAIAEVSYINKEPLCFMAPKEAVTEDFMTLTKEILERIGE